MSGYPRGLQLDCETWCTRHAKPNFRVETHPRTPVSQNRTRQRRSSSGPLRGFKRDLYEGGIRVPLLARWPGKIKAGTVSDHVCAFWDFLPTAAKLAVHSIAGPARRHFFCPDPVRVPAARGRTEEARLSLLGVPRGRLQASAAHGPMESSAPQTERTARAGTISRTTQANGRMSTSGTATWPPGSSSTSKCPDRISPVARPTGPEVITSASPELSVSANVLNFVLVLQTCCAYVHQLALSLRTLKGFG